MRGSGHFFAGKRFLNILQIFKGVLTRPRDLVGKTDTLNIKGSWPSSGCWLLLSTSWTGPWRWRPALTCCVLPQRPLGLGRPSVRAGNL